MFKSRSLIAAVTCFALAASPGIVVADPGSVREMLNSIKVLATDREAKAGKATRAVKEIPVTRVTRAAKATKVVAAVIGITARASTAAASSV